MAQWTFLRGCVRRYHTRSWSLNRDRESFSVSEVTKASVQCHHGNSNEQLGSLLLSNPLVLWGISVTLSDPLEWFTWGGEAEGPVRCLGLHHHLEFHFPSHHSDLLVSARGPGCSCTHLLSLLDQCLSEPSFPGQLLVMTPPSVLASKVCSDCLYFWGKG